MQWATHGHAAVEIVDDDRRALRTSSSHLPVEYDMVAPRMRRGEPLDQRLRYRAASGENHPTGIVLGSRARSSSRPAPTSSRSMIATPPDERRCQP